MAEGGKEIDRAAGLLPSDLYELWQAAGTVTSAEHDEATLGQERGERHRYQPPRRPPPPPMVSAW